MPRRRNTSRRRRRGSLGPLLRVLSVLLAAAAIVAALTLFFKVDEITVTGNDRYSAEEIVAASQVERGDNLILLDKYRVKQQLFTQLPYISEVRISPQLPDTLLIDITETKAAAAIRGGGGWWLISGGGKVLEAVDSVAAREYLPLEGVEAALPEVGSPLALPEESAISRERLLELLYELDRRDMLTRCDTIDLGDGETLVLDYDGRFQVRLNYEADFSFKLDSLREVVQALEPNEQGVLRMDMEDDNEVRFIPYAA